MNKVQSLSQRLEQRLLTGEWVPGDKLPAQDQLVSDLGVARTTLRESVGVLQGRGLLQVRHGSGTYVNNLFEESFIAPLNQISMHDPQAQLAVLEMRQVLEGEAAWYACQRASDQQLAEIGAEYQRMLERAESLPLLERSKEDLKFHMLIAHASHNLIVASLSQLLYSKMFNTIFAALSGGMLEQPGCMELVDRHHSELHIALMQRDGVNAKRIAQAHARHTARMLRQQIQL